MFGTPVCVMLLSATFAFGQQVTNQSQKPQAASPQTSPNNQQGQTNPQDKAAVNSQIQSNIQNALSGDPTLNGTDVQASVDDVNITLTGSVQSEGQLARVIALVSPYTQYRKVVNKVVVH